MRGSQHNDLFFARSDGTLGTRTNNSGGVQVPPICLFHRASILLTRKGGISNGEPIIFRVAFKPPATIGLDQKTVDFSGKDVVLAAKVATFSSFQLQRRSSVHSCTGKARPVRCTSRCADRGGNGGSRSRGRGTPAAWQDRVSNSWLAQHRAVRSQALDLPLHLAEEDACKREAPSVERERERESFVYVSRARDMIETRSCMRCFICN